MKALLLVALLSGCGTTLYARPGVMHATDTYVHHGVDLSHAVIADDYFRIRDLVLEQMFYWNSAAADEAMELLAPLTGLIDLRVSVDRNRGAGGAVLLGPGAVAVLGETRLHEEIAPYLDPDSTGRGIVTIVDSIGRDGTIFAHTVVFDRATGEPFLVVSDSARGLGSTVSLRYFYGLTHVARTGTRRLARLIDR